MAITSSLFLEISLANIKKKEKKTHTTKKENLIRPPEPRPQAKSYFRWFSSYQRSQRKTLAKDFFLRIYLQNLTLAGPLPPKIDQTLFFNWSLPRPFLKRFCSRQVPHVGSHPNSLYPGIPDLSIWVKGSQVRSLATKSSFWELIRLARLARLAR